MCTEIDIIQRDIDSAYHGSVHLRENIIRACRGHSALVADLINSVFDTSELINNLYASIVNYEAVHKFVQQSYLRENESEKAYFTDRQYRRDGIGFYPRFRGQRYNRFGNSSRESSRGSFRRKRCFVCDKEGC